MKKLIHSICFLFFTAIVFSSCISTKKTNKNDNKPKKQETNEIQKNDFSYKIIDFSEQFDYLETKIKYPEFKNFPVLNKYIKNTIFSNYDNFKSFAKTSWTEINDFNSKDSKSTLPPFEFNLESEIYFSKNIISVLLKDYVYSGGAHGNINLKAFNYHTEKDNFLSITDLINDSYNNIARECRTQLEEVLIHKNEILTTPSETDQMQIMINEGTFPQAGNFEIFTIEKNVVTVYFEPYSVAPYSYGIQKATIKLNNR